jgi:hypothetical protein
VAQIYKDAKAAHGIVGPMLIIIAEVETKVNGRIACNHHWDTLTGLCGPNDNHVCVFNYNQVVGSGEEGYNKIVDIFCTNRVGALARVVMVNLLHQNLPRLVLVVMCICNCFDVPWVRQLSRSPSTLGKLRRCNPLLTGLYGNYSH